MPQAVASVEGKGESNGHLGNVQSRLSSHCLLHARHVREKALHVTRVDCSCSSKQASGSSE